MKKILKPIIWTLLGIMSIYLTSFCLITLLINSKTISFWEFPTCFICVLLTIVLFINSIIHWDEYKYNK